MLTLVWLACRELNRITGKDYRLLPFVGYMADLGLNPAAAFINDISPTIARRLLDGEYNPEQDYGCSPGSTLKKKKGQTSDQCGSHHHTMGGLAYAKTQGLGPTVPQPGLFPLSADAPGQR
jgi:hypothetical protein